MSHPLRNEKNTEILSDPNLILNLAGSQKPGMLERMASLDFVAETGRIHPAASSTRRKKIVLFMDGTWNDETSNTNVRKIFNCAVSNLPTQSIGYISGIGTKTDPITKIIAGATGLGLSEYVKAAYRFLVENYNAGDEIDLVGYSRGSYIARALVGMINKGGLIDRNKVKWDTLSEAQKNMLIDNVFDFYKNRDIKPNDIAAKSFRKNYSHTDASGNVTSMIEGLYIFDTVGALGVPDTGLLKIINWATEDLHKFYDTNISSIVKNCFHAVAADERRKAFPVTLALPSIHKPEGQTIVNMIFAGEHYVGGGTASRAGLSDTAGIWMISQMKSLGVQFDEAKIKSNFRPDIQKGVSVKTDQGFLGKFGKVDRDFSAGFDSDPTKNVVFVHPSLDIKRNADADYNPLNVILYPRAMTPKIVMV